MEDAREGPGKLGIAATSPVMPSISTAAERKLVMPSLPYSVMD
jgi:hypothetical protein